MLCGEHTGTHPQIGVTLCRAKDREDEQVKTLYNSSLSFNRRIYDSLDVALGPIRLSQPLDDITKQPLLYIRGQVPHACFLSLTRYLQREQHAFFLLMFWSTFELKLQNPGEEIE